MTDIDELAARYADAVFRKDEAAFLALYAADAVVYDLWDQWFYAGREAWARSVQQWFGSLGEDRVTVGFTPTMARIEGDAAAWCAIVRYAAIDPAGSELRSMENRMSWSLFRRDGDWSIVHQHSSAPATVGTLKISLSFPSEDVARSAS